MRQALIIVDVQKDFVDGGSLAVPNGTRVIEPINELIRSGRYDKIIASKDWHPPNHVSFAANHGKEPFTEHILHSSKTGKHFKTTLWPTHCVEQTQGAEFADGLETSGIEITIFKGNSPNRECYSVFSDVFNEDSTQLERLLLDSGISSVTIVGLALDFCVMHTALDAAKRGFTTTIELTATLGITPKGSEEAIERMLDAGIIIDETLEGAAGSSGAEHGESIES